VNNQYRGDNIKTYQSEFRSLLNTAIIFTNNQSNRVFVLSIPDWGVTPFAEGRDRVEISRDIDEYNGYNHEASMEAGVHYIDITDLSRRAAYETKLLTSDGLHPSGKMYRLWVGRIMPTAEQILINLTKS
jgi:lysophospholipase L1-like esterase